MDTSEGSLASDSNEEQNSYDVFRWKHHEDKVAIARVELERVMLDDREIEEDIQIYVRKNFEDGVVAQFEREEKEREETEKEEEKSPHDVEVEKDNVQAVLDEDKETGEQS